MGSLRPSAGNVGKRQRFELSEPASRLRRIRQQSRETPMSATDRSPPAASRPRLPRRDARPDQRAVAAREADVDLAGGADARARQLGSPDGAGARRDARRRPVVLAGERHARRARCSSSSVSPINWFGDSLDGTLARVRQHQRPRYGYYVDHVVDAFGALFLFGGLALSGYMSPAIALRPAARLFHAVDRGLPRDAQRRHVQDQLLQDGPDRAAHPARDRQPRAARPSERDDLRRHASGCSTSAARSASPACSSRSSSRRGTRNTRTLYRAEPIPARGRDERAVTGWQRFVRFNLVGALGIGRAARRVAGCSSMSCALPDLVATLAAVSAAIVHNFVWHLRWTWRDRRFRRIAACSPPSARFALANGAVSLVGNVVDHGDAGHGRGCRRSSPTSSRLASAAW